MKRIYLLLSTLLFIFTACTTIPEEYRDGYKGLSPQAVENFNKSSEADKELFRSYWVFISLKEREQFINTYTPQQKKELIDTLQEKIRKGDFDEVASSITKCNTWESRRIILSVYAKKIYSS